MVLCILIMCLGVIGNIMVPIVILKTKDMRNSTNIFLTNLSIADLLVLLVCTPTVLVEVNTKPETWVLGEEMCKAVPFIELTVAHASVLTILAISFERYYAICEPLKAGYVCTKTRAILICFAAWTVAAIFTSPILLFTKYDHEKYIDQTIVAVCLTQASNLWIIIYYLMTISLFFVLPLIILIIIYTIIAKSLILNKKSLLVNLCSTQNHKTELNFKARKQVVLMLAAVVLSFFICLLPFRLLTLWIIIVPYENIYSNLGMENYYFILYFCRIMIYLNSAINPILYNLMSSKFRRGFVKICFLKFRQNRYKFNNLNIYYNNNINNNNNQTIYSQNNNDDDNDHHDIHHNGGNTCSTHTNSSASTCVTTISAASSTTTSHNNSIIIKKSFKLKSKLIKNNIKTTTTSIKTKPVDKKLLHSNYLIKNKKRILLLKYNRLDYYCKRSAISLDDFRKLKYECYNKKFHLIRQLSIPLLLINTGDGMFGSGSDNTQILESPILLIASYQLEPYGDGTNVTTCTTSVETFWPSFFYVCTITLFFLIPFFILIILYSIIAKHLMKNNSVLTNGSHHHRTSNNILKYRKQIIFMLIAVVLNFFLCLLPFRALTLWIIFVTPEDIMSFGVETFYKLLYFCRIMLYLNSAINPILYNLMSSKFRNGFINLLKCKSFKSKKIKSGIRKDTFHTISTNLSSSYSGDRRNNNNNNNSLYNNNSVKEKLRHTSSTASSTSSSIIPTTMPLPIAAGMPHAATSSIVNTSSALVLGYVRNGSIKLNLDNSIKRKKDTSCVLVNHRNKFKFNNYESSIEIKTKSIDEHSENESEHC